MAGMIAEIGGVPTYGRRTGGCIIGPNWRDRPPESHRAVLPLKYRTLYVLYKVWKEDNEAELTASDIAKITGRKESIESHHLDKLLREKWWIEADYKADPERYKIREERLQEIESQLRFEGQNAAQLIQYHPNWLEELDEEDTNISEILKKEPETISLEEGLYAAELMLAHPEWSDELKREDSEAFENWLKRRPRTIRDFGFPPARDIMDL